LSLHTTQEAVGKESGRPYAPSWVDLLTDWVRRLPLPAWVFYLALGLVLTLSYVPLILSSPIWTNGGLTLDSVVLYSVLNGMTGVYVLAFIHYLDNSAQAALARFRPVLTVDDAEYENLRYQLTTLPAVPTLIASCLGVAYAFVALQINTLTTAQDQMMAGMPPLSVGLVWTFNILIYVLVAVLVYHTLHQLLMVNAIYTRHTHINLFQLGPLYALSGLTARTAIGIGIPTYVWFQTNSSSELGSSASNIIQTVLLSIVIVLTFIWPLLGAHNLLEREKFRLEDEVTRRMESTVARLHSHADTGELTDFKALKEVLDGLVTEQGVIEKLRTWPWRTETARGVGVAFLLPIFIWVIQRVLERLGA